MREWREETGDAGSPLPADLRWSIGHLLRKAFVRFTAEAMRDGPRSREFVMLDVLADEDGYSQQELAERLGINRTIMVRLVDRLEDSGQVTRERNPANRRSYVLSITEAGRKAVDDMRQAVFERDARVTAALTPAERLRLRELLSRLLPEPDQPAIQSTEYLVSQAHYRLRRLGDRLLADIDLRTRHFGPIYALEVLAPCPQQQLARQLMITEPAAAEVVDELVRAGIVARGQDPHDRRRYALALTDLGRQRVPIVKEALQRIEADVLDALGPDAGELRTLLTKLLDGGASG
ncbi:MarR family winged helix-turn-helix transcriptional regulator [Sphaerisporangium fuscum]|uniref:MarR family winged helix-turn-helix transcriptional regulator n=1 Tax=Sphaerisporangium fuscum TaxID=2835868 RepID=UPI0027E31DB3|nr:MarR family transcriptional regulator [Sphaerisporangium fuscum]